YEGYSEDPEIVYEYAQRMVNGIQGGATGLKGDTHVISNVKHWVGDGGTLGGVDHGQNRYTEEYLRNIHSMGYYGGLKAGAQVVMSSFNSWWNPNNYDPISPNNDYMKNQKLHGSKYLITDVLKGKMGFDGIVVTDWNGQGEVNGCSASDCAQAVIAGNDIFMVTSRNDWQAFYRNVIKQVKDGTINMARIDDAVTRILRVKLRANLWEKPKPSARSLAGNQAILSSLEHVAIARQAVSESLVLLKNDHQILPLKKSDKFLVTGSAANDITKQTGGWSLSWQGDGNTLAKDFPNAQTLLIALQNEVGKANVFTDETATNPQESIAIVAIGEDPYAEMFGDINDAQTLEFSKLKKSYAKDLETIKSLKAAGYKVVTIFFSGRPLYVNEEINHSDAFVAAWLPGTEGVGMTDVLFAKNGADFKGKLSYSWGAMKCSTTINRKSPNLANYITPVDGITGKNIEQEITGEHDPLFPYGYGLNYAGKTDVPARYADLNKLPLDPREYGCGMTKPDDGVANIPLEIFGKNAKGEFRPLLSGVANSWAPMVVTKDVTTIGSLTTTGINYDGMQQSAINVKFKGKHAGFETSAPAQFYMQTVDQKGADYTRYLNANSTLEFDIRMKSPAPESLVLATHCEYPCMGQLKINKVLPAPSNTWKTIKVPLACFKNEGMFFQKMNTPFLMFSEDATEFDLGNIRFMPNAHGLPADAIACSDMIDAPLPPLTGNSYSVLHDFDAKINTDEQYTLDKKVVLPSSPNHMTASLNSDGHVVVRYNNHSAISHKGLLHFDFAPKNMQQFINKGHIELTLNVKSFGQQNQALPQTGLVIKLGTTKGTSNDVIVPALAANALRLGEDIKIDIPMSSISPMFSDNDYANKINRFTIFSAWGNTQAGVEFTIKNIVFKQ
ncbi:MAG: glycoside hydrolase family 3 N-terminal domain-containing protein, partial [Aeromonas sp.]